MKESCYSSVSAAVVLHWNEQNNDWMQNLFTQNDSYLTSVRAKVAPWLISQW